MSRSTTASDHSQTLPGSGAAAPIDEDKTFPKDFSRSRLTLLQTYREKKNAPSPTRSSDSSDWSLMNSNAPLGPGIISKRFHLCSVPTSNFLTYSTKNNWERGKKSLERSAKWMSLRDRSQQHKKGVERMKGNLITLLNTQSTSSSSHLGDQTPSSSLMT
jgi:hypothetical protein